MESFGSLHYMIACIIKDSLNLGSLCATCTLSFPTRSWVTNPAVTHAMAWTFGIDFVQHLLKGCLNSLAPFLLLLFFLSGLLGKILWQLPQCLPYHPFLTTGLCIPVLELQRFNKIKETVIQCCTSEGYIEYSLEYHKWVCPTKLGVVFRVLRLKQGMQYFTPYYFTI